MKANIYISLLFIFLLIVDKSLGDPTSAKLITEFKEHTTSISTVAFSPDGQKVFSGGSDNLAYLWDVETGNVIQTYTHPDSVSSSSFSPDGRLIATITQGESIFIWDANSGKLVQELLFQPVNPNVPVEDSNVEIVLFAPLGNLLIVGGTERKTSTSYPTSSIKFWDTVTYQLVDTLFLPGFRTTQFEISPDGKFLAVNFVFMEGAGHYAQ